MSKPFYVWVARDFNNGLYMYFNDKPSLCDDGIFDDAPGQQLPNPKHAKLDDELFPEVTHSNSPVKYELVEAGVMDKAVKALKRTAEGRRVRRVLVTFSSHEKPYEAFFHTFSTNYEEFDNGPGLYPVAIVETLDGTVKVVPAEQISFFKDV